MYHSMRRRGRSAMDLTLVTFGKKGSEKRDRCAGCSTRHFRSSTVLTFLIGVAILFWQNSDRVPVDNYSLLFYFALVIASMIAHEAAHLIAAVAFGYPVSEAGVIFYLKILPGLPLCGTRPQEERYRKVKRSSWLWRGLRGGSSRCRYALFLSPALWEDLTWLSSQQRYSTSSSSYSTLCPPKGWKTTERSP